MDKKEAEFAAKLLELFNVEAREHLKAISDGLLQLEKPLSAEQKKKVIETSYRETHNLKGGARAVGFIPVQKICQSIEDILLALKNEQIQPNSNLFNLLFSVLDKIEQMISIPQPVLSEKEQLLIEQMQDFLNPEKKRQREIAPEGFEEKLEEQIHGISKETIRINSLKLSKLFSEVEELLYVKLLMQKHSQDIQSTTEQFNLLSKNADIALLKEKISSLCDQLGRFAKQSKQEERVAENMINTLLYRVKTLSMQPLATLFESLPRVIRDISQSLGKDITFSYQGGEIEVDRRILEGMKDPLMHLIRNAIDHGLGTPEERQSLGKSPKGALNLIASQVSGNFIQIQIIDDGKGINIEAVKKSAIQQKIITPEQASALTEKEALLLIFHSGISASEKVSEISGRGLGLKIVFEKVSKLGGQVNVDSIPGKGTTFTIKLPLTMATFHGVYVRDDKREFIIPSYSVRRVLKIPSSSIKTIENRQTIQYNKQVIQFTSLCNLLKYSKNVVSKKFLCVLVLEVSSGSIAIEVDEVVKDQEVIVKSLGRMLPRIRNISAATITEAGTVVPILDPYDLISSTTSHSQPPLLKMSIPSKKATQVEQSTILIVEDSITARTLLKNILETAGYQVKTAVDGIDAFLSLKTNPIQLLLTDIEMPRMDGFELTEKVRNTEQFKNLPIILISSRGSREDKEKGIELGANAYIDKSNFEQSNFLKIIEQFI